MPFVGLAVGCGGLGGSVSPSASNNQTVLVRPQSGISINDLATRYHAKIVEQIPGSDIYALIGDNTLRGHLAGDPNVASAEDNDAVFAPEPAVADPFHFPTDFRAEPLPTFDVGLKTTLNAPASSTLTPSRARASGQVIVAVLDTGVATTHPALQNRLLTGYSTLSGTTDASEVADGQHNRGMGHGTMVAGVIARLAPDAQILPIRVLNGDGVGTVLSITKGIEYALAHGARVINLSLGIKRQSGALDEVFRHLAERGAVLVAAAGNDNTSTAPYPAASDHVIAVASVENDLSKSTYSNFGSWITVVAPGSGMESTWWAGGYAQWSGTSFSAPCVSAEAACLFAANPNLSPGKVQDCIRRSATTVDAANPNLRGKLGTGLVQFQAALTLAQER